MSAKKAKTPPVNTVAEAFSSLQTKLKDATPSKKTGTSETAKLTRLQALITLQSEARSAKTENELAHIIANESRNMIPARQIFVVRQEKRDSYKVAAVSAMSEVERNALLIRSVEKLMKKLSKAKKLETPFIFNLSDIVDVNGDEWSTYPFRNFIWQPLSDDKAPRFAGMLMSREKQWQDGELTISAHLGEIYAHAWRAILGPKRLKPRSRLRTIICWAMFFGILLFGFAPVPLTALAPAEITSRDATVITAPIDGVVDEILVKPNTIVTAGQPLVRYVDANLQNDVAVAEKRVEIARARERQYNQGAFDDAQAGQQLNVAASELALAEAELLFAKDQLAKAVIVAPKSGIAMFNDPDEWKGRPVKTGTRVLRLSDPSKVELEVQMPVADAISLEPGSRIRFFLDNSPLDPVEAVLNNSSYEAATTPSGTLAYTITGKIDVKEGEVPRIGLSGVAQVFGERVPLFFYLLRKPITSARQYLGF